MPQSDGIFKKPFDRESFKRTRRFIKFAHTYSLEILKKQAEKFHADELQVMFAILTRAEMEMKRSSLSQMVFEMALLRLIETRPFKKIDELINKINQAENSNIQSLASSIREFKLPRNF